MKVTEGKKIYFASDNHLGLPDSKSSLLREKKFVKWLDFIKEDAHSIYLLGQLFDFWFEYKTVVPKGFIRFLGKIADNASVSDREEVSMASVIVSKEKGAKLFRVHDAVAVKNLLNFIEKLS